MIFCHWWWFIGMKWWWFMMIYGHNIPKFMGIMIFWWLMTPKSLIVVNHRIISLNNHHWCMMLRIFMVLDDHWCNSHCWSTHQLPPPIPSLGLQPEWLKRPAKGTPWPPEAAELGELIGLSLLVKPSLGVAVFDGNRNCQTRRGCF